MPSSAEFEVLTSAVGGKNLAGLYLKATTDWDALDLSEGTGKDSYGFAALPASLWNYTGAEGKSFTNFWSSSKSDSETQKDSSAYVLKMSYRTDAAELTSSRIDNANSVRCLKGEKQPEQSSSSAKSSSSTIPPCKTDAIDTCEYGLLTDDRDGQEYKTVKIKNQVWMAENLNFKTDNSSCVNNSDNEADCKKVGRYYTWAMAMDSAGIFSANGMGCGNGKECAPTYHVRGICPEHWHLPTAAELRSFIVMLGGTNGGSSNNTNVGWPLMSLADWAVDPYENMDAYGFSLVPTGVRKSTGQFVDTSSMAYFWCSTEAGPESAENMTMWDDGEIQQGSMGKGNAVPVRCFKD